MYSVYTISNPPSSCTKCSFLSVQNHVELVQLLVTPPIKDNLLVEHLTSWIKKRLVHTTEDEVKDEIKTYLTERQLRAKTIEYKVEVTNCSEQISGGLVATVKIIPSIEDPDLKNYVREITTSDSAIVNRYVDIGRLIESGIREWQSI